MALFSMAVPKDIFGAMFGIKIDRDIWPCEGLPPWCTFDRGPGASQDLIKEFENRIPIRELSPSWSGQSKATIESSHPRDVKFEGRSSYVQSDKSYIELARREIERTIRDNQRHTTLDKLTPNMASADFMANPLGLWNYLSERRRTNAHRISFDAAVRNLLNPIEFTAREDGVYLHGQRFDSEKLRDTGIHDKVLASGRLRIPGYGLILSLRQAWVEVTGQIIPVEPMLAIRDSEGQLYFSFKDLINREKLLAIKRSRLSNHRLAVDAESQQRFEDDTGKGWDTGKERLEVQREIPQRQNRNFKKFKLSRIRGNVRYLTRQACSRGPTILHAPENLDPVLADYGDGTIVQV